MAVVTFNGLPLPQYVRVTGVEFSVTPEIQSDPVSIARRRGTYETGLRFRGKRITLKTLITIPVGSSLQALKGELYAWLKGDNWKPSKLTLDELPGRYLLARVEDEVQVTDNITHGEADITFYASDPAEYDLAVNTVVNASGVAVINYTGAETVFPVITINVVASCNNLTVTNSLTGDELILIGAFNAGQTVTIDCSKKLVKVGSTVNMLLLDISSDWVRLVPGTNTLTAGTYTAGVTNSITVDYRRQW